jgi:hypothetical protein
MRDVAAIRHALEQRQRTAVRQDAPGALYKGVVHVMGRHGGADAVHISRSGQGLASGSLRGPRGQPLVVGVVSNARRSCATQASGGWRLP